MKLSAKADPRITSLIEKMREKYLYHDRQNEIIRLMAFIILRDIAKNTNDNIFYSIMTGGVTDCSNKEQFNIFLDRLRKVLLPMKTLLEFTILITLKQTLLLEL